MNLNSIEPAKEVLPIKELIYIGGTTIGNWYNGNIFIPNGRAQED